MNSFVAAIQFLTRISLPGVAPDARAFAASMRWFPAIGILLGLLILLACWSGRGIDDWTAALLGLAGWTFLTGALHLDGLGDIADAAGAAHKGRDRILAVLADPHLGSFGTVAIGLQLLAKLVLIHALLVQDSYWPLIAVPAVARLGTLVWTLWLPPLHEGLGAQFRAAMRWWHLGLWSVALVGLCLWQLAFLSAPLLFACWGLWLRSRIGGISGDGHGAGIELVETGLLFALLLAGSWA